MSLILSTKGRTTELAAFLTSLQAATAALPPELFVELIISDQNEDTRLDSMLLTFESAWVTDQRKLQLIKSQGGLSRGRNAGLQFATGDVLAFPDDDCTYSANTLVEVTRAFTANPLLGFLGVATRDATCDATTIPLPPTLCGVNARWMPLFSPTLFVRRSFADQIGPFDEDLGVGGSYYGAGEETDYVLRLLRAGALGVYQPSTVVYHPAKALNRLSLAQLRRQLSYGRGLGKILLRHKDLYGYFFWVQLALNVGVKPISAIPSANRFCQALAYSIGIVQGMLRWHWRPDQRSCP